jgi:dolichol kinase
MSGKSLEGSLACFAAAALAGFFVFREWKTALVVGFASAITDAFPLEDLDNIVMPLAAGLAALAFR